METQSLEMIAIPYEATSVREEAKRLGARWRPVTKQWALPAEAAAVIRAQIETFEAGASIQVYRMHEGYGTTYNAGEVLREDDSWVTVVRTDRWFCDPDDGMCNSQFDRGFHYVLYCRLATEAEYRALDAALAAETARLDALRAARKADDQADAAPFESVMAPPAAGSEAIVISQSIYGSREWWEIEPEGTEDRRIIRANYRGGDGDAWYDGNYGLHCTTGLALPWTAEMESVIRAAACYWAER